MEFLMVPPISLKSPAAAISIIHFVAAAAVTAHALINKRDVPAAIGWIGIAWLAPFSGALLYFAFGVNRVKRRARLLMGLDRNLPPPVTGHVSSDDPTERLKMAIGKITGQDVEACAAIAVLDSGNEAYPQMLAAIEGATSGIALSTYIFRDDDLGRRFIGALTGAHRRGVRVRVLIDGVGGGFLRSTAYHRLREQGVPVARFLHSVLPWRMPMLNLRLHKKILVVDAHTAFVGGLNIGAENLGELRRKAAVRDTHFRVEGTVVQQIEQDFEEDWSFTTGEPSIDRSSAPTRSAGAGAEARTIVAGPDQDVDQLVLVLLSGINLARHSIKIATPYFLPDEQLLTALQLATLRGVDVRLVLPAVNNHRLVGWAARAHIRPLLQMGCRVWRSPAPFDHTKLMTIDGTWSLIGSANWDMRSLRLNFELTVELYDAAFAERIAGIIDGRCVEPVSLREIDGRWLIFKLRDAAARLMSPYL